MVGFLAVLAGARNFLGEAVAELYAMSSVRNPVQIRRRRHAANLRSHPFRRAVRAAA